MNNNGTSVWVKITFIIIVTLLSFMGTQMVSSYTRAEDDRKSIRQEIREDRHFIAQKFELVIERLARIESKL